MEETHRKGGAAQKNIPKVFSRPFFAFSAKLLSTVFAAEN